jgi:hypothetical protein
LVATADTPGDAHDVAVAQIANLHYAFVADGTAGLQAFNVSDPLHPQPAGSFDTPGTALGVAVTQIAGRQYALVADGANGLRLADVTDPANPQAAGWVETSGTAYAVAVGQIGNLPHAFVADGVAGLLIVDVSDPASPQVMSHYDTVGEARGVALSGIYVYAADGAAGLQVIDVSDPTYPQFAAFADTPGTANDVTVVAPFSYVADHDQGLRVLNPQTVSTTAAACDTAGNCSSATTAGMTTAGAGSNDLSRFAISEAAARFVERDLTGFANLSGLAWYGFTPRAMLQDVQAADDLWVSISGAPALLDTLAPVSIGGQAVAMRSSLQALTVTADGAPILSQTWDRDAIADVTWTAAWTPAGDGQHLLQATVSDWAGNTASDAVTVTVDAEAPQVAVTSLVLTTTHYYELRTVDITGLVTDTAGVASVEWRIANGEWRMADGGWPMAGGEWRGAWQLPDGPLPDGATYNVTARALDLAGHATEVVQQIVVDVLAPAGVDLALTAGGAPVAPGETTASPDLTLTWTAATDGSGVSGYTVRWTAQITETQTSEVWETSEVSGPRTSTFIAGDGQQVMVQLGSHDALGNIRWQTFGPVYVDSPLTPDYVYLPSPSAGRGVGGEG